MKQYSQNIPIIILLCAVFVSCRSAPVSLYTIENPISFEACNHESQMAHSTRSYASMLAALKDYKWTIVETTPAMDRIRASACLGLSAGSECVTMVFEFDRKGNIVAYTHADTPIKRKMDGHVIRWKNNLSKGYSNHRCMSEPQTSEILKTHGLSIQQTSTPTI